ncbi:MAG: hypothetical protein MUC83_10760, partial [Pirellula sp.]|nr:hypothetical protein [Pirellula sp.]
MSASDLIDIANADAELASQDEASGHASHVPPPKSATPLRVYWLYVIPLVVLHALALLAFVPWFFSWSGLVLAILGHFTF